MGVGHKGIPKCGRPTKPKSQNVAIEKDEFLRLLDKFITRSDSWIKDAEVREDYNDVFYYQGQKDVSKELKDMVNNWIK